jgi:hypothetical protein
VFCAGNVAFHNTFLFLGDGGARGAEVVCWDRTLACLLTP